MKKTLIILLSTLTIFTLFSCEEKKKAFDLECVLCHSTDHVTHPKCTVCNEYGHLEGTCCSICFSLEHTEKDHPICSVCGSVFHIGENCDLVNPIFCTICQEKLHNTEDHPYCEIKDCDKSEMHTTEQHPNCPHCLDQHSPFCYDPENLCDVCGLVHEGEHPQCSICMSLFHDELTHPLCSRCSLTHVEQDINCPNYCEICLTILHNTEGHPRCAYCGEQRHYTDEHPVCSVCNKRHKEASADCPNGTGSGNQNGSSASNGKAIDCTYCAGTNNGHTYEDCPHNPDNVMKSFCSRCSSYGHTTENCTSAFIIR